MIIHVFTIVRDEEYMLPFFLRHYSTFADKIFVIDDYSADATPAIALAHPKVTVMGYPHFTGLCERDIALTYEELYKVYSRGVADWVMIPDVDEMIYHPKIRKVLEDALEDSVDLIKCTGYAMVAEAPPQASNGEQIYDLVKTGTRCHGYDKPIVFNPRVNFEVGDGRHTIHVAADAGTGIHRSVGLLLLHFHDLSPDYIANRIRRNFSRMPNGNSVGKQIEMRYRIRRGLESHLEGIRNCVKVI